MNKHRKTNFFQNQKTKAEILLLVDSNRHKTMIRSIIYVIGWGKFKWLKKIMQPITLIFSSLSVITQITFSNVSLPSLIVTEPPPLKQHLNLTGIWQFYQTYLCLEMLESSHLFSPYLVLHRQGRFDQLGKSKFIWRLCFTNGRCHWLRNRRKRLSIWSFVCDETTAN